MMGVSPVLIVLIGSGLVVGLAYGFCYWRRERRNKEQYRNKLMERRQAQRQHHYLIPHMDDEDHTSTSMRNATLTAHENRSNRQVHLLSNDQQPTIYLSGNGPNQNNRSNPSTINLALTPDHRHDSVDARLIRSRSSPNPDVPVIIELSTLPPIHPSHSTTGKRTYPKQFHHPSNDREMFSSRDSSAHDLRIDDMGQSHLPRPLHMQRPVIADMNISSSTKVVANIIRAPSPSGSFIQRSPSPSLRVIASAPEVPPIPVIKREAQRPRKLSKPEPVAPVVSALDATDKLNTQSTDTDPDLVTLPVYEAGGDPFMSKEELRNGPQALLTANLHNLVDPAPSTGSRGKGLLLTEEVELTTAHLVLMPYLQVQPETPPLPSAPVPSESMPVAAPKVQTSPPSTPEKSPKRNSFRTNENSQQEQQQQASVLTSVQDSATSTMNAAKKPIHAHHHPHPPPPTKINTGVASNSGNTSMPPPPPPSRKTVARPSLQGRQSTSSSAGSPTSTLVATPTSATTPRSPPVSETPPPVPVLPLAYTFAAEAATPQVAADATRTVSPSPSNTSSSISTGTIISSIYSASPSTVVAGSPMGSMTNVSCATSPTVYSPTTPINSGVDSAVIRNHAGSYYHDDFLKKYNPPSGIIPKYVGGGEEEEVEVSHRQDTLVTEKDGDDDGFRWPYKVECTGNNEKRVNHPQAADGAGTRFSQFNFQYE